MLQIVELQRGEDATAFRVLNEEWITKLFALEPKDLEVLNDPERSVLDRGGRIFFAKQNGSVVGCVALIPFGEGVWELSKMAVSPAARNAGIGRALAARAIEEARRAGARRIFLGSSTKLPNALHLYRSLGFREVNVEELPPVPYRRADVFMTMDLKN